MSPKTPQQNREIREQSKQQILDAAFELFANNGYSQTSISLVAERAGVSKGLIYHYFDSKKAVLGGIFDQLAEISDEVLAFPDDFTPADKIRQVLDKTFEFIEDQPEKGRLMIGLALQPDTFSTLKSKIDEINSTQMVLYIRIFEELGFEEPELEAYQLGALMDGILLGFATRGDEYPLKQMKRKIMNAYVPSESHQ